MLGNPDKAKVSTSHVERSNLSIRMGNRRFTRLTNAHSKKYANHVYALALFFMHYNFVRVHKALRMSPAMASGIMDVLWSMEDIAERVDARVNTAKPRGPYKKPPDRMLTAMAFYLIQTETVPVGIDKNGVGTNRGRIAAFDSFFARSRPSLVVNT